MLLSLFKVRKIMDGLDHTVLAVPKRKVNSFISPLGEQMLR